MLSDGDINPMQLEP